MDLSISRDILQAIEHTILWEEMNALVSEFPLVGNWHIPTEGGLNLTFQKCLYLQNAKYLGIQ